MKFILPFILLFGCVQKENFEEKVLNLVVGSEIKGMDPIYANDLYSSNEVSRIYEGLLQYDYLTRPYKLITNLAQAMPKVSNRGKTYTFKIKKGVYFHDSPIFEGKKRELVAEDFIYSIKRLADPKLQGLGYWLLEGKIEGLDEWRKDKSKNRYEKIISGLKATGKYTLQFTLKKPFPQFLYALAMPFTYAVAREVVEKHKKEFLNHPVGTGPYILPRFTQSNKIIYTHNPNYRKELYPCKASVDILREYGAEILKDCGKPLPLVKKVVVSILKEAQPRWLNFQKGRFDAVGIPKDNFDQVVLPDKKALNEEFTKKGIDLSISPSLDVTYVAFNHDEKLFQNVNLRRALFSAYNQKEVNRLFYNNTSMDAQSVIPPGISGYDKNYRNPYRGDGSAKSIERAKKLLAKAGYPEGKKLPVITYDTVSSTVSRQMAEYFKSQMATIGVKLKVVQNTWPSFQKKITDRKIMLYGIAWGADYPDAENFLQLLYGPNRAPGANGSGYDNPEINNLFRKAVRLPDSPKRARLYRELNIKLGNLVPLIYGFHRTSYALKHGWLENRVYTEFSAGTGKYLNINLKKKKELFKKL